MIISKAASFPFPAQKGENNCSSHGLKGPVSPSPGGSKAFPGSTSHFSGRTPAGSWQLPAPPHPPGNERSRSPGVHTFLRQRAGLSLCPPPFQPPLCRVPPGTAELKLTGSTKGIPTQVHPHWQRTCGCLRGGWSEHTQLVQKRWMLFLP